MRDQLLFTIVHLAFDTAPPDRLTPIVVAAISAAAAIGTALVAVFARKPDDKTGSSVVTGLREDVRVRDKRIEQRDREIDRLQALCWSHGIDPRPPVNPARSRP